MIITRDPIQRHLERYPNARASTLVHLIERDKTSARLEAEIEARIAKQVAAGFRTFAINTWRAYAAGRL